MDRSPGVAQKRTKRTSESADFHSRPIQRAFIMTIFIFPKQGTGPVELGLCGIGGGDCFPAGGGTRGMAKVSTRQRFTCTHGRSKRSRGRTGRDQSSGGFQWGVQIPKQRFAQLRRERTPKTAVLEKKKKKLGVGRDFYRDLSSPSRFTGGVGYYCCQRFLTGEFLNF